MIPLFLCFVLSYPQNFFLQNLCKKERKTGRQGKSEIGAAFWSTPTFYYNSAGTSRRNEDE